MASATSWWGEGVFKSLQARLTLSYIAVIVLCLLLVGLAALLLLRGYQRNLVYNRLVDLTHLEARTAAEGLRRGSDVQQVARLIQQRLNTEGRPAVLVLLLDTEGRVLAASNARLVGQVLERVTLPGPPGALVVRGQAEVGAERVLYTAAQVRSGVEAQGLVLFLAQSFGPGRVDLGDLLARLAWAGAIALALSVVLAALIAYSISRPLEKVTRAAEEIAAGNYDQQLDVGAPEEVARLATSFNMMSRQIKAALESQRDLVANVSHELKTPLTSIQGFSQALVDGTAADAAAQARAATIIHDEAGRMRRLVDELLDLARLEGGQVSLARELVDAGKLLRDCAARFAPRASEMGVALVVDVPPDLPAVTGDGDRLEQVVSNLVDNALKHAHGVGGGGQVTLNAVPGEGWLAWSVTDNGPGIPRDELARVFERFYQVDRSRARRGHGAGLGLAIAREIVHAHGGRIRAESVEGLGARFTVELPVVSSRTS
ncbi:MAG: HAMP domain-containing protein [Anaerolineae bacterium]|nr:HAMP domain-containing protein [Anaerolineae bacterium]